VSSEPEATAPSDTDEVERHLCPRCGVQPGSPCRSRSGAVAGTYHTGRFTKVPRLAKLLRVPTPTDRGPGQPWRPGHPAAGVGPRRHAERGHPRRLRPLLAPHPGTSVPARRAGRARHPQGQDLR
jgi:hypothetical protein